MGSESNRGGAADRMVAEEEEKKKRGGRLFEMPEIRFTKLFINGCFVDAASGTPSTHSLPASYRPVAAMQCCLCSPLRSSGMVTCFRSGSLID
jgi:hypothetical protein